VKTTGTQVNLGKYYERPKLQFGWAIDVLKVEFVAAESNDILPSLRYITSPPDLLPIDQGPYFGTAVNQCECRASRGFGLGWALVESCTLPARRWYIHSRQVQLGPPPQ
jgi:hypothetical protein